MLYQQDHGLTEDYFTFEKGKDLTFPMHMHSCFELIVVTEGMMEVEVDEIRYTVSAGSAIFIFPYQFHAITTPQHSEDTLCIFNGEILPAIDSYIKGKIPQDPVIRLKKPFLILEFSDCTNATDLLRVRGILYLYLHALLEETKLTDTRRTKVTVHKLLKQIFLYVNEHYGEACTLKVISDYLKYDYSYISRLFSENMKMSFHAYVTRIRITKACQLLRSSKLTMSEVCLSCGFASLRSFNRNFYHYVGMTPTAYRSQYANSFLQ